MLPLPPGASLVAIDVRTGAIVACASGPRFDLNVLAEGDATGWNEIQADPRKPLFDRATRMTLPPGSVFKAISAVAFLEGGHLDPEAPFHCQGFLQRPDQYRCLIFRRYQVGHGDVTLVDALAKSCNVYFFHHAKALGPESLHQWAARFGIGQKTGVDLPGEQAGRLPAARPKRDERRIGETLQLSIGQADLTVTPLQMARMMAAIANGGTLVMPHFAESTGPSEESEAALSAFESQAIPELSSRTLAWVRRGLEQVVANPKGTGYKTVRHEIVSIAGKTGTAEPGGGRPDHAWFAGYVPADRPKIAFAVVLEHAGSGGHAAGPVAKRFVDAMLQHGLLGRTTVTRAE
jgi:penicillin-binding protein 2